MKITYMKTIIQVEFPDDDTTNTTQEPVTPKDAFEKLRKNLQQEQRHGRNPEIWEEVFNVTLFP